MKRTIFSIVLMSIATLFVACDNKSSKVDEPIKDPTVKVEAGVATAESISFTITSTDAESVAYLVVEAADGTPSEDAIFKGTTVDANKAVEVTVDALEAETEYIVAVAAEAHNKVVKSSIEMTTLKAEEPTPNPEPAVEIKAVEAGENFLKFEITTTNAEKASYVVYRGDQYDQIEPSELVVWGSPVDVATTEVYTSDNLESATAYKVKVAAQAGETFVVEVLEMTTLEPEAKDIVFATASSVWNGFDHSLTLKSADESIKLVADIYTYNSQFGYLDAGVYTVVNTGYSFSEGEIDYYYSSITIDDEKAALDSGTVTVAINDDLTYDIVVDVVDANGRELKGSYNGAVEGMSFENGFKWVVASRNVVDGGADGRFNITFKTQGTDYADYLTLDFYAEAGATKLPAGTYTIANSTEAGSVDLSSLSFTTFSYDNPVIDGGEVVVEALEDNTYNVSFRMTEKDSHRVWICSYEGEIYNMEQSVAEGNLTFVSANGYFSGDSGESYVYLVADNGKQLKLGLIDLGWSNAYITPGTYNVSSSWAPGSIYSGWYGTDWNDGISFKSGDAVFEDNGDGTYTITVNITLTNDESYAGKYVGAIDGYTLPGNGGGGSDETALTLTIERAKGKKYTGSNYGVMLFTPGSSDGEAGDGQEVAYVNLDLYNLSSSLDYIAAGTYTVGGTDAGELDKSYTKIMMEQTFATSGSATFAINADKTYTISFVLSFDNGKTYTGSYTGNIEGITVEDAGTTEPTATGIVSAAGKCYSGINYGVQLFTAGSDLGTTGEGQEFAYINLDLYNYDSTISYIAEGTYVVGGANVGELDKAYTKISYDFSEKFATDGWVTFSINEDKTYTISFDLNFEDGRNVADTFTGNIAGITVE